MSSLETGIIQPREYQIILQVLIRDAAILENRRIKLRKASQSEKEAKSKRHIDNTRCACCLKPFVIGRGVECGECEARACRKGCSRWDTPDNAWYCLFCHQRRLWLRRNEKWIETFGGLAADHDAATQRFSTAKSQVFLGGADYAGIGPGLGLATGGDEEDGGTSVERVREFVEKIVGSLVGDVDEIAIDRIYDHEAYDELMESYREPLAGALARLAVSLQLSISNKPAADTPTMAHAALRDLVERAVEEARKLPGLGASSDAAGRSGEANDISEQTYEDLLATAILNKVIEKYQNELVDTNRNTLQDSDKSSRTKYITSEIEVGLDEGVEEGSSSLEPLSQDEYSSDCSAQAPKYSVNRQEPLSLTIEEHIEEVTTTYTSDEEEQENEDTNGLDFRNAHRVPFPEFGIDIIDPSQESSEDTQDETALTPTRIDLITNVESWEENWLFQKKKMQAQSEPVSMLVPNPSEDVKPLIGDREAEDTSDLSDCAAQSDDEEIEEELLEAINNAVIKIPASKEAEETLKEDKKKIEAAGENDSTKKSSIDSKVTKNEEEEKKEEEPPKSPHIKLGFEDMLVFHLKDNRSQISDNETENEEKLLLRLSSRNEEISESKSNSTFDVRSRNENENILINTSSTYSAIQEKSFSKTERVVETKIENNKFGEFRNFEHEIVSKNDSQFFDRESKKLDETKLKTEFSLFLNEAEAEVKNDVKSLEIKKKETNFSSNQFDSNNLTNFEKLGQETRALKPVAFLDETDSIKSEKNLHLDSHLLRSAGDKILILKDENELINLDGDTEPKEVPTSSSSISVETTVPETGIKVDLITKTSDEKLVSNASSRVETKLGSLNKTLNSFDRRTDQQVRSSSSSTFDKVEEVVEARLIFVNDSNENLKIVKTTEIQGIENSEDGGAQKEGEYTEHYATATQRHLDSLTRSSKTTKKTTTEIFDNFYDPDDIPPPIPSTPPPIAAFKECREAAALSANEVDLGEPQITAERKRVEVDVFLATPPRPGTIAEREHKKWENAAPIENNPYSEENIQKRLWQRQYSRKLSSDTSTTGEISEAPKMPGTPLQVVLGAGQPDVKRYGRDYYINDAKKSVGERAVRRSAILNTVRRNSSLSQTSGSNDEDIDSQDKMRYQANEGETISNSVKEVKSKVTTWQKNNIESSCNVVTRGRQRVEATIYLETASDKVDVVKDDKIKSIDGSFTEITEKSWPGQNNEEILENVRRNSKNELNAKLNNQEDAERISVTDARKSSVNDNQKAVNRLDLKAYGFANEIKSNGVSVSKISEKRVVNKLDLKSLGYDSELHRIQEAGKIDARLNNEINSKPRIIKMKTKSNLTERNVEYEKSKSSHNLVEYVEASGDFDKTKSAEILKDEENNLSQVFIQQYGGMISAKSMPNVTKTEHYSHNFGTVHGYKDEEDLIITHLSKKREKIREEERLRQEMIKASAKRQGVWKSEIISFCGEKEKTPTVDETDNVDTWEKSTEISTIKEIFETATTDVNISSAGNIDEELPMPSVRKLAQSFVETPAIKPAVQPRIFKPYANARRERPTTPEIQLIETPRQMHSLTARSLSREFREGLRQIPNKLNSTVINSVNEQQISVRDNDNEIISSSSTSDNSNDDINVIAPGKLKNDIKFWEQLQRRS